jgi:alkaline phosphatase
MGSYTEPLLGGNNDSVYNRKSRTVASTLIKWVPIVVSIVLTIYVIFQGKDSNGPVPVDVKQKKNIIFMVTDGMGPASVSLARSFRQYRDHLPFEDVLTIDQYFIGSSRTRSNDSLVTDSAAGATAFSCGLKTYNGAVGVDADKVPCGTILEALKFQGYLTGLVVTTKITDATPAAFSSHVDYRFQEDIIAEHQLGEYPLGRSVDLILGGGRCHFLPTSEGGCRADKRNLIQEYNDTWSYVGDRGSFDELNGGKNVTLPLLGLLANTDIPYDLDRDEKEYPSLAEQVKVALTALSEATKNSDQGFFLLIEGSRIDHAGHHNDPAAQVREVLAYDKAFKEVIDFIDSTDVETVAISTSDHETGGLVTARQVTSGYPDYLWYPEILLNSKHSGEFLAQKIVKFSDKDDVKAFKLYVTNVFENDMGITDYTKEEISLVLKNSNNVNDLLYVLNDIISLRSQTGWTTHGHSAVDVNIYGHTNSLAIKQRLLEHKRYHGLSGNHENIEIGAFLESITGSDLKHITKLVKDTYHSPSAKDEHLSVNQFQHLVDF